PREPWKGVFAFSISRKSTPRRARSIASDSPAAPAPQISTSVVASFAMTRPRICVLYTYIRDQERPVNDKSAKYTYTPHAAPAARGADRYSRRFQPAAKRRNPAT